MTEIVDMRLYTIITFICMIFYDLGYAKLNNYKMIFNFKNIFYALIATILNLLTVSIHIIGIKVVLNFIIFSGELKLVFKDNWKRIITSYILICLILGLMELIITNALLYSGIITNSTSANSLTYINLIITLLEVIGGNILLSINILRNFFQKLSNIFTENKTIYNIIYLIFITIAALGIINVSNFDNHNSLQLILVLVIIFVILFISIIRSRYNEEMLKISNNKLIDYNDKYGKFLDEYKIYKHNIKHKLSAMKTFGNKKVNALIDELLEEETTFSIRNNNIYNIPNGIKGIVAEKLYNKKYDVLIYNNLKEDPFIKLEPKSFNSISECLGIALDNAIEASEETKTPIITMDLYEDENDIYIKVGNNYCNNIDLDKIGDKYYSTKNRGSGLGLFSIKRNHLIKEEISIINDFYYIELQLKKAR